METRNGTAYTCRVVIDGQDVGHIENDGNGGAGVMRWSCSAECRNSIEAEIKSLPPVEFYGVQIERDLDCLVDEAINKKQGRQG